MKMILFVWLKKQVLKFDLKILDSTKILKILENEMSKTTSIEILKRYFQVSLSFKGYLL